MRTGLYRYYPIQVSPVTDPAEFDDTDGNAYFIRRNCNEEEEEENTNGQSDNDDQKVPGEQETSDNQEVEDDLDDLNYGNESENQEENNDDNDDNCQASTLSTGLGVGNEKFWGKIYWTCADTGLLSADWCAPGVAHQFGTESEALDACAELEEEGCVGVIYSLSFWTSYRYYPVQVNPTTNPAEFDDSDGNAYFVRRDCNEEEEEEEENNNQELGDEENDDNNLPELSNQDKVDKLKSDLETEKNTLLARKNSLQSELDAINDPNNEKSIRNAKLIERINKKLERVSKLETKYELWDDLNIDPEADNIQEQVQAAKKERKKYKPNGELKRKYQNVTCGNIYENNNVLFDETIDVDGDIDHRKEKPCTEGLKNDVCQLRPKSGSFCALGTEGTLFYQFADEQDKNSDIWKRLSGFECNGEGKWVEIDSQRTIESGPNQITIKCRSAGCAHPKHLFDNEFLNLQDKRSKPEKDQSGLRIPNSKITEELGNSQARINFGRSGEWKCYGFNPNNRNADQVTLAESYGETTREINENQMIPSGGYCKLTCSNGDVEELKNIIVCDDLKILKEAEKFKNLTYEQSDMPFLNGEPCPWGNLGKLYKELSASRWNKKDLMVLDDGNRDGWKCY